MNETSRRLWPFSPRTSVISAAAVLAGLLLLVAVFRALLDWPSAQSENIVLIGVVLIGLLPIALAVFDAIIDRGAIIEYAGVTIDFSRSREVGTHGFTVPANIGVRGESVADSGTTEILDALKSATANDIVIINLEDGRAWWETRLLVLLAGAERLGKPEIVVFVGKDARKDQQFLGWAYAKDLLPCLAEAHLEYPRSLQAARAAASQWELMEPIAPGGDLQQPPWLSGTLASQHQWMVFDYATGLRNPLLAEQFLQSDLGSKVESQEGARHITIARLEDLFRPVLNREFIELSWDSERQINEFFQSDSNYLAITSIGKYLNLVPSINIAKEALRSLLKRSRSR